MTVQGCYQGWRCCLPLPSSVGYFHPPAISGIASVFQWEDRGRVKTTEVLPAKLISLEEFTPKTYLATSVTVSLVRSGSHAYFQIQEFLGNFQILYWGVTRRRGSEWFFGIQSTKSVAHVK